MKLKTWRNRMLDFHLKEMNSKFWVGLRNGPENLLNILFISQLIYKTGVGSKLNLKTVELSLI